MGEPIKMGCNFLLLLVWISGYSQEIVDITSSNQANAISFDSYEELSEGKTQVDQVSILMESDGYSPYSQWKLSLRLNGDFVNNNSNGLLPAEYATLELNTVNEPAVINSYPARLSSAAPVDLVMGEDFTGNVQLNFNLTIEGGTHLYDLPGGHYQSEYTFFLQGRDSNGNWVEIPVKQNGNNSARFRINYTAENPNQSIVLQNSADHFSLEFSEESDYVGGVSSLTLNGLRISSKETYQVMVRASNSEFSSNEGGSIIPVSVLHLETVSSEAQENLQVNGPLRISTADQVLINRTDTNPQEVDYDLRFFVPPNEMEPNIEAGTYSANIYFVIVPN